MASVHDRTASVPGLCGIVKLGGSLARHPKLSAWLAAIAGDGRAWLVVPGGGPFADAVRTLQAALGFDDRVAHAAAILSMQQYALFLAAREPRLMPVERPAEIAAAAASGRAMLWLPWAMVGRDGSIEASWRVSADSLALILAIRLAAPELVLVKAAALPAPPVTLAELAARGILDPAFPELASGYRGCIRLARAEAPQTLAGGGLIPTREPLLAASGDPTLHRCGVRE